MINLPKIDHPTFTLTLPSTGEKVAYRPFTGKEQKILLIAKEANDGKESFRAVADVAQSCIVGAFNVYNMPVFDIEYLFLMIRSKSVANAVDIRVLGDDEKVYDAKVNLDEVRVVRNDKHDSLKLVKLSESSGIKLKYPTVKSIVEAGASQDEFDVFISSIDTIYNEDVATPSSEFGGEDLVEIKKWLTTLPVSKLSAFKEFFETRPKIIIDARYKDSTGKNCIKELTGLSDFFEYA